MSAAATSEQHLVELLHRLADGAALTILEQSPQGELLRDPAQRQLLIDHGVVFSGSVVETRLCIPGGLDVLQVERVRSVVASERANNEDAPLPNLQLHWSIGSTNTALLARARSTSIDREVLLAEHQSAGRGRRGRNWLSPVACNLYISIGAQFRKAEDTQALSLCVGVALADALAELGYAGIGIKWPNDLHIRGRKLSGILIESAGMTRDGVAMVIGIGVNVRVPACVGAQIDQPWIDLAQAADLTPDRNRLCGTIIARVLDLLDDVQLDGGRRGAREQWLERFRSYDVVRDVDVTLHLPDREVHGIARGIDAAGELRVEVDGELQLFSAGEVSLRRRDAS